MSDYRIRINVSDAGGVYTADSMEEANEIAESVSNDIYNRLKGSCSVSIESVEVIE